VAFEENLGRREELPGRPGRVVSQAGDPGARGSARGARAIVKCARPLPSRAPARDLLRPRKWNATVEAGVCRLRLAGSRCGNAPRRPTQPASLVAGCSEAKASLACEDRRLVGCVRASNSVAEVCERRRGSEKRDFPWQGGAWTGAQARGARKSSAAQQRRRQPAPGWQSRGAGVGQSRMSERASRGEGLRKMEDIPGRLSGRSFTRAVLKTVLAALTNLHARA